MTDTPKPPRQRSGETKRESSREALLWAAQKLTQEHGADAKIEDIAKEAGVSVPTLYNVYPSKSVLLRAIFNHDLYQTGRDPMWCVELPAAEDEVARTRSQYLKEIFVTVANNPYVAATIVSEQAMATLKTERVEPMFDLSLCLLAASTPPVDLYALGFGGKFTPGPLPLSQFRHLYVTASRFGVANAELKACQIELVRVFYSTLARRQPPKTYDEA